MDEEETFRQRSAVAAANRPHRDRKHKVGTHEESPPVGAGEEGAVVPEVAAESHQSPVVNGVSIKSTQSVI